MKKRTIISNGRPFTYDDEIEDITYENISAISKEDARALITTTKQCFDKIGLTFYLAWGTLLGAIREKGLIPGDEDVDVYVTDERKLYNSLQTLYDNGLKVCRIQKGHLYSFKTNSNAYIDIYIVRPSRFAIWSPWCVELKGYVTPKKYFKGEQEIDFLGVSCKCVANPEALLEFWYGKTWRIPIRGHNGKAPEIRIAHYWHWLEDSIKRIIKFIICWNHLKKYIRKDA